MGLRDFAARVGLLSSRACRPSHLEQIDYRILGPLEVLSGPRSLPLGGLKQRAVLGALIVNANRVVSRERLIDDLWGNDPPETAVATVQTYISRLRKLLPPGTVVTRPPGYVLTADAQAIDVKQFEALVTRARTTHDGGASQLLRKALELWRGTPLAELREPFAQIERARLEHQWLAAVEQRIEADLALGRDVELIGELEQLIAEHPHRERLHGQLMLALYRSGAQAEALAAYQRARATLSDLGLEPCERLRHLQKAILTQDTALMHPARTAPPAQSPHGRRHGNAAAETHELRGERCVFCRTASSRRRRLQALAAECRYRR